METDSKVPTTDMEICIIDPPTKAARPVARLDTLPRELLVQIGTYLRSNPVDLLPWLTLSKSLAIAASAPELWRSLEMAQPAILKRPVGWGKQEEAAAEVEEPQLETNQQPAETTPTVAENAPENAMHIDEPVAGPIDDQDIHDDSDSDQEDDSDEEDFDDSDDEWDGWRKRVEEAYSEDCADSEKSFIGEWEYREEKMADGLLRWASSADLLRLLRGIARGWQIEGIGGLTSAKLLCMSPKRGEYQEETRAYERQVLPKFASVVRTLFLGHSQTLIDVTLQLDRNAHLKLFQNLPDNLVLPSLKTLELEIREIEDWYFDSPGLDEEAEQIWRPLMYRLAFHFPSLETLKIDAYPRLDRDCFFNSYFFDDGELEELAAESPDVENWVADVKFCGKRIACLNGTRFPNLKKLELTGSVKRHGGWQPLVLWTLDGAWLGRNCPFLEHLELRPPFGINVADNAVETIIKVFEGLPLLEFARMGIYATEKRCDEQGWIKFSKDEKVIASTGDSILVEVAKLVQRFGSMKRDEFVSPRLDVVIDILDGLQLSRIYETIARMTVVDWMSIPGFLRRRKMMRFTDMLDIKFPEEVDVFARVGFVEGPRYI